MRINHALVAVIASVALCSQAEAQLLDRLMGMGGCGCKTTCCDTPVAGAGCGTNAVAAPACDTGCNDGCDTGCGRRKLVDFRFRINWDAIPRPAFRFRSLGCGGCDTGCGEAAPACGTNVVSGGCGDGGAKAVAPGCGTNATPCGDGCDSGCDNGCGRFNFGLMDRLRGLRARIAARPRLLGGLMGGCGCGNGCDSGCDSGCAQAAPSCGTNQPTPAGSPAMAPKADAPMQPTPKK